ncbi:ribonuclease H-like domain-containing protein [Stachybotrys elegans]|uniref:Ribonuclease H-like domain-containing protein n=1 Tax=Stachybotrys elegans TaxID=80388 RepID=A0A8K0T6A9_9HYPO|nr:ribonuclease H-like domain-containing protein [Stachybotrys elegans]
MAENEAATGNNNTSLCDDPLVWIDCEMTGLNPDTEEILEIYCIVTTGNLEVLDEEGFHAVVHFPQSRLDQMDEWCTRTHAGSGLMEAVLASTTTPEQAAAGLYDYVTRLVPEPRLALLAGNSVHADRAFLRLGPYGRVIDHLHYRLLDVSAIKEAARRWAAPRVVKKAPKKKGSHKARDDILESIAEARHFRDAVFRLSFDAAPAVAVGGGNKGKKKAG